MGELFDFESDNMTNLRLACVLLVLAAVCWEAYGWEQLKKCGTQMSYLSCGGGRVIKIKDVVWAERSKRWANAFHYNSDYFCNRHLRTKVPRDCNGKRWCHFVTSALVAGGGCDRGPSDHSSTSCLRWSGRSRRSQGCFACSLESHSL